MELNKALSQINEIHGHLAKTEIYRGYRSIPVALNGAVALAAGFLQPMLQPQLLQDPTSPEFATYWVGVALLSALLVGTEIVFNYCFRSGTLERRKTRKVVGQFLPSVVAGIVMTPALAMSGPHHAVLLPGIWAVLFSMGIFASRPYLPGVAGWVALFYLAAGVVLLVLSRQAIHTLAWGMGITFGVGQWFAALVLYWNLERKDYA
jgi:hypothetical protein